VGGAVVVERQFAVGVPGRLADVLVDGDHVDEEVAVEAGPVGHQRRPHQVPEQRQETLGDVRVFLGVLVAERIFLVQQGNLVVERAVAQRVRVGGPGQAFLADLVGHVDQRVRHVATVEHPRDLLGERYRVAVGVGADPVQHGFQISTLGISEHMGREHPGLFSNIVACVRVGRTGHHTDVALGELSRTGGEAARRA